MCGDARLTSKADIDATQTDVCFVPIADMPASLEAVTPAVPLFSVRPLISRDPLAG